MVMDNPDIAGATPEEETSEDAGQVASPEPTTKDVLARLDNLERNWEDRFARVFNGMQATTQREVGRVAERIVNLEATLGDVLTKGEITKRLLEQGAEKEDIDRVVAAVAQERTAQQLEQREHALKASPPTTGPGPDFWASYWSKAEKRLIEHAHREGMFSTADIKELVDESGFPRDGHEDEVEWFRSLTPKELGEPASMDAFDRAEERVRRRITADAEKKAKAKGVRHAVPPAGRPMAAGTPNFANTPTMEISDEDWLKHSDAIMRERILRHRR